MATVHATAQGSSYKANPVHRNGMPGKSQWAVDLPTEHTIFEVAEQREWTDGDYFWGLHLAGGKSPLKLGTEGEFMATFTPTDVGGAVQWHGYPSRPQEHPNDMPSSNVLDDWERSGYLSRAKRLKVLRQQLWHF